MDLDQMDAACSLINDARPELNATLEYPGCISVALPDGREAWFGDANETFGASINILNGDMLEPDESDDAYIETDIPCEELDSAEKIAEAVLKAVPERKA